MRDEITYLKRELAKFHHPAALETLSSDGKKRLTERQKEVLEFVRTYLIKHGYPPTTYDVARGIGVKGNNGAHEHLNALKRKGWIIRKPNAARGIQIVP
jgi:repressor LexA